MILFKQYLKTFSLAYLLFTFILWFGSAIFYGLNELASYLFWLTIIFGFAVILVQSMSFAIIPFKVTRKKFWFFLIALIIELILLNFFAAFRGAQNFTVDTIIGLLHGADELIFPVAVHFAIIISILIITLIQTNKDQLHN